MGKTNLIEHLESVTAESIQLNDENARLTRALDELTRTVAECESDILKMKNVLVVKDKEREVELQQLRSEIRLLKDQSIELAAANEDLLNKVALVSSDEAKKYQIIIEENAVKAEMRVEEKDKIINKKNEFIEALERRILAKDEKIKCMNTLVEGMKESALKDHHTIRELNKELKSYTDPTFTQLLENPIVLQQIDTAVELANISSEKKKLEKQMAEGNAIIAEQKKLVSKLTSITNELHGTVTPKASSRHASRPSSDVAIPEFQSALEVICLDEDVAPGPRKVNPIAVSPSSMAKRVKERTTYQGRTPKNLSPFAGYGKGNTVSQSDHTSSSKCLVRDTVKHVLLFDDQYIVMSKTPGISRHALQAAWSINGPKSILWKGSLPMSYVSTGEAVGVLKHEKLSETTINAWGEYVGRELSKKERCAKTHIMTSRLLLFLKQEPNPNHKRFLDVAFTKAMVEILEAEIILFPLNIVGSIVEGNKLPEHWVLLKYVRVSGEWHLYNPMEQEADLQLEVNQDELQLVVDYTEAEMKEFTKRSGRRHPIEKRVDGGRLISKRCPQIVRDTFDAAVVVCSLVERVSLRDYNITLHFTNEMAGRYRSKMVQCFLGKMELLKN